MRQLNKEDPMADILTRIYTYTGTANWTVGASAVPLSDFAVSGDTRPITQILSVEASYWRYHDTSSTVTHTAELLFASGAVAASNPVPLRGDGDVFHVSTSFPTPPSAADFNAGDVTLCTDISNKKTHVYWRATAAQPMTLTITYYSSEFKPSISAAKLYRADALGAASDGGTYLTFTAKLAVESAGTNGSGTLALYAGDDIDSATALVYSQGGIAGSTSGVTVTKAPVSGYAIGLGEKKWFRLEFSYTAATSSGVQSTEVATLLFWVGNVFTNVHLAGASTGGVRIGGYSTSTEGNPKFECDPPAYFYGGIAVADGGSEELVLGFDSGAPFEARADNPLAPTLRRFGHVVELHGEMQPTQSIAGSTTYYTICTIPAAYAPHHSVCALQQGSSQAVWMLRVFPADNADNPCKAMFARYRSGSSWAAVSTSTWLPFHATWII